MGRARGYIRDPLPYPLLLGLCCLSFLTTRASGVCPEFRKYQDEHVAGGRHLAEIPGLSRCQAECLDTQACSGVDYGLNGCWIHTSQVADEDIQPLDGNTFYRLVPCQSGCTLRYPTRDDVTAPVDVVIRRPGVTRTECQVECRAEDRCVSFLHNDRENTCYLATNPVTMTTGLRANTTHYGKQLDCNGPASTGCTYIYYGEYGTKEYMELKAPTVTEISQCCKMCCKQDACVGVTFHLPSASQCRLLIDLSGNRTTAWDLQPSLDGTVTYIRASDKTGSCVSNPCKNQGTCTRSGGASQCHCLEGYSGSSCESIINPWHDGECGRSKYADAGSPLSGAGVFIVGGQEARPNEFPWQVHIIIQTLSGSGTCGGTILNSRWILTAAHCVSPYSELISTEVTAGQHVRSVREDFEQIFVVPASATFVHEDYDSDATTNDVALLKLPTAIEFNDNVLPACSPTESNLYENTRAVVSGWGRTTDGGTESDTLLYIRALILPNTVCAARSGGAVPDGQLCIVDGVSEQRGICQGDSGGPITVQDPTGRFHVLGAASFVLNQCADDLPDFYVRATFYFSWISSRVYQDIPPSPWYANCLSFPCVNGSSCVDIGDTYRCDCVPGFTGTECQTNIDECASNPCQNGANCVDDDNRYNCTCQNGFTGNECEINTGDILHAWYDGTCGAPANPVLAVHPLIAGGEMAEIGQLPWQVRVLLYRPDPPKYVFVCTGTILNKRWVITSRYCLEGLRSNVYNFPGYLPAVLTQDEVAVELVMTEDHPGYSSVTEGDVRTRVNDVALLRLTTDMVFTQNAQPVCPPDLDRSYEGETAVLAGWGEQQDGGGSHRQLRPLYVSMEITDPSVCETAYADVAITQFPFDHRTLCDDGDATKGFCTYDWGAPLVVKDAANRWRLVGTASWRDGCNSENPGVYSRIRHFLFWITQQIHRDSQT